MRIRGKVIASVYSNIYALRNSIEVAQNGETPKHRAIPWVRLILSDPVTTTVV